MFSQRAHVWLLAFVLGSGVGFGNSLSALKSVFQILESEYKLYYFKIWKCPTNLHLQNQIGCYVVVTAYNEVLEGSINPDCVDSLRAVAADDVTLGSTRWRWLDLLIVLLEGSSNLTLSIKVTEVTSCLQPYSLRLENKGTADRPSLELAAVIGGDMVTVNVEK
jgi:hypothetical protein